MVFMGVDIGQKRDHSAICVAETDKRNNGQRQVLHYTVRYLQRFQLGFSFLELAQRIATVAERIERKAGDAPLIYVDATGLGMPVVDLLCDEGGWAWDLTPVYFNHGDRRTEDGVGWDREVKLGKAYLVSRLQTLLQAGYLHLPRTPEAKALAQELRDYEIEVTEDANDRYGDFKVGSQDDLVTALGLAVQCEPPAPGIY